MLVPALLLTTVALVPQEDAVVLRNRKVLLGTVLERGEESLRFNPYRSTQREMTWGIEELPAKQVKEILPGLPAVKRFRRDLTVQGASLDGLLALAERCEKEKLKEERLLALEQALRVAPSEERVLSLYGASAAHAFLRSDPASNAELRQALESYLACADGEERRARIAALQKQFGLAWPPVLFERSWRSAQQAKGRTDDRSITLRGDEVKGVYTLYVPGGYEPFRPTPLVIALHGGGADGREADRVVGSGTAAMSFYQAHAERLGWIVACPTALRAPWSAAPNDALIRALLEELKLLFHVDRNRIYLTGHSMGGFGTWHFGPKYCEEWAAIGPLSGGGSNGIARLAETKTFVYLYHGGDDAVVGPGDSRNAAKALLDAGNEFVYTELPSSGHGFPTSIQQELFACFELERRAVNGRSLARPDSSFAAKETKEEERFFGPLFPRASESAAPRTKELVRSIGQGGGAGERAAEQLIELGDREASGALISLLKSKKTPSDGRALAARVLGRFGDGEALKPLSAAAREPDLKLVHSCVEAIGRLSGAGRDEAVVLALVALCSYFDQRKSGVDEMSYSDWDSILRELAFGLEVLRAIEAPAAEPLEPETAAARAKALESSIVRAVLLPRWNVPHETRVRQDPELARAVLIDALLPALLDCGAHAASAFSALLERYRDTVYLAKIEEASRRH